MYNKDKEITLNAETFTALKSDFDSILNRTLGNMEMKGADEATVTLKLSIKLEKTTTYVEKGAVDVTRPSFKHDISSVMQVKDKKSGQLAEEMALIFDEEKGSYILRPITNGQMSFDEDGNVYDADGKIVEGDYREVNETTKCIEGCNVPLIGADSGNEEQIDSTSTENQNFYAWEEETGRYEWLRKFVGEEMTVQEINGHYEVTDIGNGVMVLSSELPDEDARHVNPGYVKDLVGKKLIGARYVVNGKEVTVSIEHVNDGDSQVNDVVAEADAPEE